MKSMLSSHTTALCLTLTLAACSAAPESGAEPQDTRAQALETSDPTMGTETTETKTETKTETTTETTSQEPSDHNECAGVNVETSLRVELQVTETGMMLVTATNDAQEARWVQPTLLAHLRETMPSREGAAELLEPGMTRTFVFSARDFGINVDKLKLPVAVKAMVEAYAEDGTLAERAITRGELGPQVDLNTYRRALSYQAPGALEFEGATVELGRIMVGGEGLGLIPSGDPLPLELLDPIIPPRPTVEGPDSYEATLNHYNFCFQIPMELVDAGFGEDYGTHPTNPWVARGMRTRIYAHGEKLFDGYLNTMGCTGTISTIYSDNFFFFGYSSAQINGNTVQVLDDQGLTDAAVIWGAKPGASGLKVYAFPQTDLSNLVAVSAFTVARFNGGLSGETFKVNRACRPGGCCDCASGGEIWISQDQAKFLISHEFGHRILGAWTGGFDNDCSYDLSDIFPAATVCDTSSGHGMTSAEFQSCAAMEGWAHFVATAVFNQSLDENPAASMRYWSNFTVNVENGPDGGVTAYYNNVCNLATSTVLGVELDWLRHWWDYYTNDTAQDAGVAPSQAQLMNEIDAALPWTNQNTYERLSDAIEDLSGAEQRERWEDMGSWNGID